MPYVQNPELSELPTDETPIWRFMSHSKLMSLLGRRSLFFSPLSQFRRDDPFEGSLTEVRRTYLKRMTNDEEFARSELHIPADQVVPEGLLKSFDPQTTSWTSAMSAQRTYVNCWHISPHESAHLWATYAAAGEGVAVKSTVARLVESLRDHPGDVMAAPVKYIDYTKEDIGGSYLAATFHKRLSFAAEQELRLCTQMSLEGCLALHDGQRVWRPPSGMQVGIDLTKLIEEVRISPLSADWVGTAVKDTTLAFGYAFEVKRSSINDPAIL